MNSDILHEDFGFTPLNLKHIDTLEGKKIYSSSGLKDRYVKAISQQGVCTPVIDKIKELVDKDIIVPCYTTKNLFELLKHKFTGTDSDKSIMGFYYPTNNKVYILFDNRLEFLSWVNNKSLSLVTIHELMHYVAKNSKKTFYNIFKHELIKFYDSFYLDFASAKLDVKQIEMMIIGCLTAFEWSDDVDANSITKYKKYLDRIFTLLDSEQKIMVVDVPLSCALLHWRNPNMFIMKAKTDKTTNRLVYALWRSYDKAFNISNPDTFPIQEILFPSEVIAISSEKPTSVHYKAINSIR